jgi:hypothetical protein
MLKLRGKPYLAEKAVNPNRASQLGLQHLDCHEPFMTQVASEPHRSHSAATQLSLYGVSITDARIQLVDHGASIA